MSVAVSFARRDQGIVASSWVSVQIVDINANSAISGKLGYLWEILFAVQGWKGYLEVTLAVWLLLPGRCLISRRQ